MTVSDREAIRLAKAAARAGRPCPEFTDPDLSRIATAAYRAAQEDPMSDPAAMIEAHLDDPMIIRYIIAGSLDIADIVGDEWDLGQDHPLLLAECERVLGPTIADARENARAEIDQQARWARDAGLGLNLKSCTDAITASMTTLDAAVWSAAIRMEWTDRDEVAARDGDR